MIVKNFAASTLQKAARKALDFWYKEYFDRCTLIEFLHKCTWKRVKGGFIVVYKGPTEEQ